MGYMCHGVILFHMTGVPWECSLVDFSTPLGILYFNELCDAKFDLIYCVILNTEGVLRLMMFDWMPFGWILPLLVAPSFQLTFSCFCLSLSFSQYNFMSIGLD